MSKELATTNGQNKPKQRRPRKSQQMSVNAAAGDNTKYLANALSMWDWQKPDMTDPVAVNARIKEYFQLCINDDMKPSVEGLAFAFGVHRKTLWAWANNIDSARMPEEVRNLIKRAYEILTVQMANYMQNGKINPVAGIFLMKNNMDYEDKKEITLAPACPLGEETPPEELQQKYLDAIEAESSSGTETE